MLRYFPSTPLSKRSARRDTSVYTCDLPVILVVEINRLSSHDAYARGIDGMGKHTRTPVTAVGDKLWSARARLRTVGWAWESASARREDPELAVWAVDLKG